MLDKGYRRPTSRSRELRANMTLAEQAVWAALSARKVAGVRFNRQFPIGPYICDFVSRGAKLVVEIDGGQHDDSVDAARTRFIEAKGYRVIRFWNQEALGNLEGVVAEIERALADMPSPSPSRKREGNAERPSGEREEYGDPAAPPALPSRGAGGVGGGQVDTRRRPQ